MAMPDFSMRQLLEAGVHFGHHTRRWNPKMAPFIFGVRNGVHILDLEQTVPLLQQALQAVRDVVSGGGRVLLVGTKRQASEKIAEAAKRCGQYYVNHRWLGGMLSNWKTISNSIKRLKDLEARLSESNTGLTKKELLQERHRLLQIEDVDAVAHTEDERRHLRVPAAGVMTEMHASFQKLAHGELWHRHVKTSFSG